jgi:hypothetical protein
MVGLKVADEKEKQWYLKNFPCSCGTEYWFEVTEMEAATKEAPGFAEERDYLYYCHKCQKNKVAFYTSADIRVVGGR